MTYDEACRNFNEIMSFLEKDNYQSAFDQIDKTVVRREQASGGEGMHRGYYCPSIIEDIVIGNINRGRLIKKLSKQKIDYTYGFDALNRLVTVINHTEVGNIYEYVLYIDHIQYGVQYGYSFGKEYLHLISKCYYVDNKLTSYEQYLCEYLSKGFAEYSGEFYHYQEDEMDVESVYFFNRPTGESYLSRNHEYKFRISKGFLTDYIADGKKSYIVRLKRKILE